MVRQKTKTELLLLLLLLLQQPPSVKAAGTCYNAAEENKSFTMTCMSEDNVAKLRDFVWKLNYSAGQSASLICHHGTQQCYDLGNNTTVSYFRNSSGKVTSRLTIHPVTGVHRDITITCGHSNRNGTNFTQLRSCRLEVYQKPENAECNARKMDKNSVRISCTVGRIFPGLQCQVIEHTPFPGTPPVLRPEAATVYESTARFYNSEEERYFRESCSMDLLVTKTGSYVYTVVVSPDVQSNHSASLVVNVDGVITIERPAVVVRIKGPEKPVDLCSHTSNAKVRLECEADGYNVMPQFHWRIGKDVVGQKGSKRFAVFGNNRKLSFFKSTINISVNREQNQAKIKCIVSPNRRKDRIYPEIKHDLYVLKLRWPPPDPPMFIDSRGRLLNGSVNLSNTTSGKFACDVTGGQPAVTSTSVICLRLGVESEADDGEHTARVNVTSLGQRVKLLARHRLRGEYVCTCIAAHVTGCYQTSSVLVVRSGNGVTSGFRQRDLRSTPPEIFYLHLFLWTTVALGIIAFVTFVAIIVYMVVRKRKPTKLKPFLCGVVHSYESVCSIHVRTNVTTRMLPYAETSVWPEPATDPDGYLQSFDRDIRKPPQENGSRLNENEYLSPCSSLCSLHGESFQKVQPILDSIERPEIGNDSASVDKISNISSFTSSQEDNNIHDVSHFMNNAEVIFKEDNTFVQNWIQSSCPESLEEEDFEKEKRSMKEGELSFCFQSDSDLKYFYFDKTCLFEENSPAEVTCPEDVMDMSELYDYICDVDNCEIHETSSDVDI
ncbi:uncharacterized protein LOC106011914 [Aplysia californica]|uniref:Uncharacterized protein LOC106011914 n=1 Tax=Aplysia californica TaxID=6500 RepID=A0ABM1A0X6_APLCA|nr:uncharacterized protein LOC106011914 [Aplysia californica]